MISIFLPGWAAAGLTFCVLIAWLTFVVIGAIMPLALVKLLMPLPAARRRTVNAMLGAVRLWAAVNALVLRLVYPIQWRIETNGALDPRKSYLLISNHQSWFDVLLLVDLFRNRIPFPRFFLKRELLWVPLIGFGSWALDFPFMKRHTKEEIAADPQLRNEDLETTRRFCERFRAQPVTVMTFPEGTRFNAAKRLARQSPFRHLLRPKAAGLSFILNAMGEQFAGVIDVTIAYQPTRRAPLWSVLFGEQPRLAVRVDVLPVPPALVHGDYLNDPDFRSRFQSWLNALWARKDARLDKWHAGAAAAVRPRLT